MLKNKKRVLARRATSDLVTPKLPTDRLPVLIDEYIELTDLYNKISLERKLLQDRIKDRILPGKNENGYGEKKGAKYGTILYCERIQRRLDVKKIEEEMGHEWVNNHKTPMPHERVEVVHRTESYAKNRGKHIKDMTLEEILANAK